VVTSPLHVRYLCPKQRPVLFELATSHSVEMARKQSLHVTKQLSDDHVEAEEISFFPAITTYLGYAVLIVFGHLRDYMGKITGCSRYFNVNARPPKVRIARF
jgi:hypothetical protein